MLQTKCFWPAWVVLYLVCNITCCKLFAFCYLTRGISGHVNLIFSNTCPLSCIGSKGGCITFCTRTTDVILNIFLKLPSAEEQWLFSSVEHGALDHFCLPFYNVCRNSWVSWTCFIVFWRCFASFIGEAPGLPVEMVKPLAHAPKHFQDLAACLVDFDLILLDNLRLEWPRIFMK